MVKSFKFFIRKVLLSTGEFTIEAVLRVDGSEFYGTAPLGLTVGFKEKQLLYAGVSKKFFQKLNSKNNILELNQEEFDKFITSIYDSQTSTALSLAYLKYKAYENGFVEKQIFQFIAQKFNKKMRLSKVISNVLNGGRHAGNNLAFCEFMIIPKGKNPQQNIQIASDVYLDLRDVIIDKIGVQHLYIGREGGFSPAILSIETAISLINDAIDKRNKGKCNIAIDVAANNFAKLNKEHQYNYIINDKVYNTDELIEYYSLLLDKFPIITYLEDPFHENDIDGWRKIRDMCGSNILIVADDLTVSTVSYLEKYHNLFNACVLKVNQAGSISELMDAYEFCLKNNIKTIISQRSGETDSNIISHLAVGLGSDYLKVGAPARERIVKYNELIRITSRLS